MKGSGAKLTLSWGVGLGLGGEGTERQTNPPAQGQNDPGAKALGWNSDSRFNSWPFHRLPT